MNPALEKMIAKYSMGGVDECINALREILQELVLLGLWRGKFFERAAFYGGSALRIFYGLDRFSEDIDFSLLKHDDSFKLKRYLPYVEKELSAWGFTVTLKVREKTAESVVESAFLKTNTREQLLIIEAEEQLVSNIYSGRILQIKLEVDKDPPPGFSTETKFCLQPIPFSVLTYTQSSLFAGKMHALLCRGWGERVKGRDWYDFVWYVGRGTELDLAHLEARMRQSGHYENAEHLTMAGFRHIVEERISGLDVKKAKADVARFLTDGSSVAVWSKDFFRALVGKVQVTAR